MSRPIPLFGLAGWSGSGKTTLITRLVARLTARGLSVSTVKHAHHSFDLAEPKERDERLRAAGIRETLFASPERWALLRELEGESEPSLDVLLRRLAPVDLVLIEGFKRYPHDKLEVHRPANGKPLLAPDDPHIVAIASDVPLEPVRRAGQPVPSFDLNDADGIAEFVIAHCGLRAAALRQMSPWPS